MELHEHFMNIVKADSVLLENIHVDISKVLQHYLQTLKTLDYDKNSLEFLRLILCYQYKLSYENIKDNNKITFHSKFREFIEILIHAKKECQSILYDIITLQLVLFEDQKDFISLFEEFRAHNAENKLLPTHKYLKVLVCFLQSWEILDFINAIKNLPANKIHLTSCKKVLLSSVMYDLQTWVYCKESHEWHALYSVLSKLIDITKTTKIIVPYIHEILGKRPALQTISVLCDLIFPTDLKNIEEDYNIVHAPSLWVLIQEILVSSQPHERKEALYVFKRLVNFIDSHEENIKNSLALNLIENKVNPFICNKSDPGKLSIKHIINTFILFMEALEEKQKHLVIPYLSYVDSLTEAWIFHKSCGNCFDFSWVYCAFARILQHDNNTVVKWGLLRSLKLNTEAYIHELFLALIVKSLNNTFLYEKFNDENEPEIVTALTNWFNRCQSENLHVIEKFLYCLYIPPWGPVPIYHVLQSILSVSDKLDGIVKLRHNEIEILRSDTARKISLHPPMLRSMSQITLLKILCRFAEIENMKTLANLLSLFPVEIVKESSCWPSLVSWLARVPYDDAEKFITTYTLDLLSDTDPGVSESTCSLIVQLLFEAGVIFQSDECKIKRVLKQFLISSLHNIGQRPYVGTFLVVKIIEFIHRLFEWQRQPPEFIYKIYIAHKDQLIRYYSRVLAVSADKYADIAASARALLPVSCLIDGKEIDMSLLTSSNYMILETKCQRILTNHVAELPALTVIFYALEALSNLPQASNDSLLIERIRFAIKIYRHAIRDNALMSSGEVNVYVTASRLLKNQTNIMPATDFTARMNEYLALVSEIFDAAGNEALVHLGLFMCRSAQLCQEGDKKLDDWKSLMRSFVRFNFKSKRDRTFWLASQKLTESVNCADCLRYTPVREICKEFTDAMLKEGESLPGLKYILLVCSHIRGHFSFFMKALLDGLLHGEVLRRDQRISLQAQVKGKKILDPHKWKEGSRWKENFVVHDLINREDNVDALIRAIAVLHLSKAVEEDADNASLFLPLVLEKLSTVQNKRYYADSQLHRLKHRIMQVLLILQPYLNKESIQILYHALRDSIVQDTDQHSVRMMKEWLLIRIYLSNEELQSDFWSFFDKICEERPGSASSVIGIIWHVARQLSKENLPGFVKMALSKLGVCCMGQQFGMRLFGQVFFIKLYELVTEESGVRSEFAHFYKATLESLRCCNFKKNPIKIDEDFFYTAFDPIQHYTLETIYHQLPRLSNVTFEEWVTKEHFEEQECLIKMLTPTTSKPSNVAVKIVNSDNSLDKAVVPYTILKSNENAKPEEVEFSEIASDMQKKIIPQKPKSPNEDLLDISSDSIIQTKNKQDIIIVASLVEKSQNLGGIARTCEIFGVKELVISNLKQIEDKEFQALSVSADKWMKINEVKAFYLTKYLMELKDNGWTLVGAEQTANSINLCDVKYPKETVLILGNEKNGIPANIIPLLDVCVEIPQFGVIRSLNVHVTSAICIWEYIKQHQIEALK